MSQICKIGCGSGFWGDSPDGARQLVSEGCDFLIFDYLAEITMALLAANRNRKSDAGYVPDFIDYVFVPHAHTIAEHRTRVVANAGGVNVNACRAAVEAALKAAGVTLKIATVTGDDLMDCAAEVCIGEAGRKGKLVSLNAYLGAREIARALDEGADIVITGRCVDSALALGPLVHHFRWTWQDYDRLAQGSLAGHLLECGAQVTGGILTDWQRSEGWERMGYPIAECEADGSFVITKPRGTGGMVTRQTVAEQLVYEVGDPGLYALPDVTCDWRYVGIADLGHDRVRVSGARGRPPPRLLKASAVYRDGFRVSGEITIAGPDAVAKGKKTADAILARTRHFMQEQGFADYDETSVEIIGAESLYGAHARAGGTREVVLKVAARHGNGDALETFAREFLASATSMAQGITGFAGGRPSIRPVLRHEAIYVPRAVVRTAVQVSGADKIFTADQPQEFFEPPALPHSDSPSVSLPSAGKSVPLIALAYGRSGDKGDSANIGVIARKPEFVPYIRAALPPQAVEEWFTHLVEGPVHRFEWPALPGFNFVLERALGGGGSASLRKDPQGKTYAQILMDYPVPVPASLAAELTVL